jgi:hypothetical protein
MTINEENPFNSQFLTALKALIGQHHTLYPRIPPQGIFFESLVERAFRQIGWPAHLLTLSKANTPKHDLLVGTVRVSLKTETGIGTRPHFISITKLCTTEREPWDSPTLIRHTMTHLSNYDRLLMLRAIWNQALFHYQLLEIPLPLLRSIGNVTVVPVGRRAGRQSLAADVYDQQGKLFRVHFDGADGKCQIRQLPTNLCQMLLEWDQPITA